MGKSLYKSTFQFLKRFSALETRGNHLRRLQTFSCMVSSCMKTKSSTLEGISPVPSKQIESSIKQAKRWLSSKWTDWESFFAPYAQAILSKLARQGELVLIMDGSETGADCVSLMLSVVWRGYAVPLVWITRKGKKGHFKEETHMELLQVVQPILPAGCRCILLGDGEFDGGKLRLLCQSLNWEFVLRTSKDHLVDCGGELRPIGSLCPDPTCESVFVEDACQGHNAVLWWAEGHPNPIPLLTNMDLGEMACAYYKRRFAIETLFKQIKSAGFNLQKSKVKGEKRVANLILVVALAWIFTFCIGLMLKKMPSKTLAKAARPDRIDDLSPLRLAFKCLRRLKKIARKIFSNLSKNWDDFWLDDP